MHRVKDGTLHWGRDGGQARPQLELRTGLRMGARVRSDVGGHGGLGGTRTRLQ